MAYTSSVDALNLILKKAQFSFMGEKSSGGFTYYGFKQEGGTAWKIIRMSETDGSDVAYAYGSEGFDDAWDDFTGKTYGSPPDT